MQTSVPLPVSASPSGAASRQATARAIHPLKAIAPLKVVAMGDSVIYGFGDPVGGGWVERLRRGWMYLDGSGPAVYNLGVRGDGVEQVAQRLEHEFRHRGELRNRVPDLLLLSVGVNDSARLGRLNGRNFTDFDQFEAAIAQLLDQAQHLCPVLFIGMVPVDEAKMPFMDCLHYNHADQWQYKEVTRLACASRQIPYLDVFDRWQRRGEIWCQAHMLTDGLHPNGAGYEVLLQDVVEWEAFQNAVGDS